MQEKMHINERKFLRENRKMYCFLLSTLYNGFQVEANEAFKMKGKNVVVTLRNGKRLSGTTTSITLMQDGYMIIKCFSVGYKVKMSAVESIEISA